MSLYSRREFEAPTPEYSGEQEVYAFFGLAMYWVQVAEQGLIQLYICIEVSKMEEISSNIISDLFNEKKTFGWYVAEVCKFNEVGDDVKGNLKKLLDSRNYIVHRYFSENSLKWYSACGQRELIDELAVIVNDFIELDKAIDNITGIILNKYGITDDIIEKRLMELKGSTLAKR